MSMQAVQEFYKAGHNNTQLLQNLVKDIKGPEDFIRNAVAEGNRQGYAFTQGEAAQFIQTMQAAVAKQKAGGELSDLELEMVAGGKEYRNSGGGGFGSGFGDASMHFNQFLGSFGSAMNSVGDWFSSW